MTLRRVGGHVCFCPHALRQLLVCSTRRCANMPHVCSSRVGGHISWRRTMCGAATATRYRRRGSVPSGLWRWQCAEHPQRHRRGRRHSQHYRERRRLQDCTQPARVLLPASHDHSHAIVIAVFTHPGRLDRVDRHSTEPLARAQTLPAVGSCTSCARRPKNSSSRASARSGRAWPA